MLLNIKVSVEPCLVSVVLLMRGCSGTGEYEAGEGKNHSTYTHNKKLDYTTDLNHYLTPKTACLKAVGNLRCSW